MVQKESKKEKIPPFRFKVVCVYNENLKKRVASSCCGSIIDHCSIQKKITVVLRGKTNLRTSTGPYDIPNKFCVHFVRYFGRQEGSSVPTALPANPSWDT